MQNASCQFLYTGLPFIKNEGAYDDKLTEEGTGMTHELIITSKA